MFEALLETFRVRRQRHYFIMVLAALCVVTAPAAAARDFMAAGILLVAYEGRSALVFLVKHNSRSWYEMPGGRRQMTERGQDEQRETAYQTAIREVFEETRGVLSPDLLRMVVDASHNMRDGGFVFFVGKIDRFPIAELANAPRSDDENSAAFGEIADYAWLSVDNVLASDSDFVVDAAGRTIRVRPQLKTRLARARAAGWL